MIVVSCQFTLSAENRPVTELADRKTVSLNAASMEASVSSQASITIVGEGFPWVVVNGKELKTRWLACAYKLAEG